MLQNIATGVTLFLAIAAAGLSWRTAWKQRQTGREAHLEARWQDSSKRSKVVVMNHGPAVAREVGLELHDPDGNDAQIRVHRPEHLPIPELSPGQDYWVPFVQTFGSDLYSARLTWRDRRKGVQSLRVYLSRREPT